MVAGEIFNVARQIALDSARTVACNAGRAGRLTNDIVEKVNPRFKGTALDRFTDRINDGLQRFCPVPGPPIPSPNPFYRGGQCPGVDYLIDFEVNGVPQVRGPFNGPIQLRLFQTQVGSSTVDNFQVRETESNGQFSDWINLANVAVGQLVIGGPRRADGLPDDCGDAPPVAPIFPDPPTNPIRPDININIDLPDIGPVDITYSPRVGIIFEGDNNEIYIPVNIRVQGPTLDIDFELDFNVNIFRPDQDPEPAPPPPQNDDDRPAPPDCPVAPECDDEPEVEPPGEEDPDEEDEKDLVVTGAVVLSVKTSGERRQTERLLAAGGPLQIPYLGLLNFIYETPDGNSVASADIPVKVARQVIPAPDTGLKVLTAVCTFESGWAGEVLIVRRPRCSCN